MMHELVQRGWVCVAINYGSAPGPPGRPTSWTASGRWPGSGSTSPSTAATRVHRRVRWLGGRPPVGAAGPHAPNEPEWQPGFEDPDTSVDACLPFYGVYDMTGDPERSGAYGHGPVDLLERGS